MSINEHNYEYFFLMYVDEELSAAERQAVEAFVIAHPALRPELELLKDTVLPAGEIKMNKNGLYKAATIEAMPANELMLYLDDELDAAGRESFDKKLETNKILQAELATWQKTKLDADELISFPGKSVLYRQEKGRLVTMRIFKWAVAAALIGAGFYTGINLLNRQVPPAQELAAKQTGKEAPVINNGTNDSQPLNTETAALSDQQALPAVEQQPAATQLASVRSTQPESKPAAKNAGMQTNRSKEAIAGTEPNPTDRQMFKQAIQQGNEILEPIESTARLIKPSPVNKAELAANVISKEKPSFAKLVSNNDVNEQVIYTRNALLNDGEGDNHIFLMEEETVAHTKAGAFFKKLKRTVARTANIKTGNSLKIAGFEFAVK